MYSGTGKRPTPHTPQREGPVDKTDPNNRIHKGGRQSDMWAWTVLQVLRSTLAQPFSTPAIWTKYENPTDGNVIRKCWA